MNKQAILKPTIEELENLRNEAEKKRKESLKTIMQEIDKEMELLTHTTKAYGSLMLTNKQLDRLNKSKKFKKLY